MKRMIGTITLLAFMAGSLYAQQAEKKEASEVKGTTEAKVERPAEGRAVRPKPADPRPQEMGAGRGVPPRGMPPEAMRTPNYVTLIQDQFAARQRAFDAQTAELKAIRDVAQQEKAKKTVDYINKLLEKKEKEFADEKKASEDRIKQMQEQVDRIAKDRALRLERQKKEESTAAPDTQVQSREE